MVGATTLLLGGALLLSGMAPVQAQTTAVDALPAYRGTVAHFTLTPRGAIDGLVLADGTEVKTPLHLAAEIGAAVTIGDRITVHGLKAAILPLVQAASIANDATGRVVVDRGPPPRRLDAAEPPLDPAPPVSVLGCVRMALHGPRGEVNGVLLDDGDILRLPPSMALRLGALMQPGQIVAAQGRQRRTAWGTVVDLTAIGSGSGPMTPVDPGHAARPPS